MGSQRDLNDITSVGSGLTRKLSKTTGYRGSSTRLSPTMNRLASLTDLNDADYLTNAAAQMESQNRLSIVQYNMTPNN